MSVEMLVTARCFWFENNMWNLQYLALSLNYISYESILQCILWKHYSSNKQELWLSFAKWLQYWEIEKGLGGMRYLFNPSMIALRFQGDLIRYVFLLSAGLFQWSWPAFCLILLFIRSWWQTLHCDGRWWLRRWWRCLHFNTGSLRD